MKWITTVTRDRGERNKGQKGRLLAWWIKIYHKLFFIVLIFGPCELHYLIKRNVWGKRICTLPNMIKEQHRKEKQDPKLWIELCLFKLPGRTLVGTKRLKIIGRRPGRRDTWPWFPRIQRSGMVPELTGSHNLNVMLDLGMVRMDFHVDLGISHWFMWVFDWTFRAMIPLEVFQSRCFLTVRKELPSLLCFWVSSLRVHSGSSEARLYGSGFVTCTLTLEKVK